MSATDADKNTATPIGQVEVPTNEEEAQGLANNLVFIADSKKNVAEGFVPMEEIPLSATPEEQAEFDRAFAEKLLAMKPTA